jgi:nicotinamide-nucleotide amidase
MKAAIITVGDEILIGQIVDTNAAWIASRLAEEGILIRKKISVGDDEESIIKAIDEAFLQADLVIMTGGLGPTKDDITKTALAKYFDSELIFSEETYERIKDLFEKRQIPISEAHRQQCYMPKKAAIIENKMGTAPGMWFESEGKSLCSMPGVPHEMRYVMEHGVMPRVIVKSEQVYRQKTIRTSGTGESVIAEIIEPILMNHGVKTAYLPAQGQVRVRLSLTGKKGDEQQIEAALQAAVEAVVTAIQPHVFGYDNDPLEAHVGHLLQAKNLTLGTAESCTGGHLAHMITSIPGSSGYFMGSVVAYDNSIKEKVLGVSSATIEKFGAVSEETVREMVQGALHLLECDIAIAVSGICGPGGGTTEKPVGTVWIAIGDQGEVKARRFLFTKDRLLNIQYTSVYALDFLRKFLSAR